MWNFGFGVFEVRGLGIRGFAVLGLGFRVFEFRIGFGFRRFEFRGRGFGFGVSRFVFSGLVFRGLGFRVLGYGWGIGVFEVRAWGFHIRVGR